MQYPLCTHTAVVSGTVAQLFRYEDMVMIHAYMVRSMRYTIPFIPHPPACAVLQAPIMMTMMMIDVDDGE